MSICPSRYVGCALGSRPHRFIVEPDVRVTARVRYSVIFPSLMALSLSHAAHPVSQVWSSEESSTTDTPAGGACWARLLSQNYVVGNITATIMWNLVSS